MSYPMKSDITRLAKAIHASHLLGVLMKQPKKIPWQKVEQLWKDADSTTKFHYRWEATQVLRTW